MILKLKDGTELFVNSATEDTIVMETTADNMIDIFNNDFTTRNLKKVQVLTDDKEEVISEFVNKEKISCSYDAFGFATFTLRPISDIEARLTELENAFDEFVEFVMEVIG